MAITPRKALDLYNQAVQEDLRSGNRTRLLDNQDLFVGTEYRQWDKEIAQELQRQGRPALSYNMVQQITETVLGNLEQRPTDIKYQALSERDQAGVDLLQSMFENDYEQGNWEYTKLQFKRDGLIHTGVMQIYIDRTKDYRGQVALRNVHPAHVVIDPWWQTDDVRDISRVWRAEWMTAEQIKAVYSAKDEAIDAAIERAREMPDESGYAITDKVADRSVEFYDVDGQRFKVVEMCYTEPRKCYHVVDLTTGRISRDLTAKLNGMGDGAKAAYKRLLSESYEVVEAVENAVKVITIAPGLSSDLVLAEGDYELQLGQVPYAVFSYRQFYGYRLGLPDVLKDAQQNFNKRKSMISHMVSQAGNNNWSVEQDAFQDSAGVDDFKKRQSLGGQVFTTTPGTNKDGKLKAIERPPVPNDVIQLTQSELDIMYQLASVVPAMQGKGETDRESGVLYEQKNSQAIVALDMIAKNIRRCDQILADMYFMAAKQVYGDAPREITDRKNMRCVVVNERKLDEYGRVVKTNTISDLERYVVDVVETRVGPGRRATELFKMSQMLPAITDPGIRAVIEKQIIKLMDLPAEEVAEATKSAEATGANALAQSIALRQQAEASAQQQGAQAQMAQQQAQMGPQQGQEAPQQPAPSGMSMPMPFL